VEDMSYEIRRAEACVFHLHSVVEFPKSFLINSLAGRFQCRFTVVSMSIPAPGFMDFGPTLLPTLQRIDLSSTH
jgi:hypothetical protein